MLDNAKSYLFWLCLINAFEIKRSEVWIGQLKHRLAYSPFGIRPHFSINHSNREEQT